MSSEQLFQSSGLGNRQITTAADIYRTVKKISL